MNYKNECEALKKAALEFIEHYMNELTVVMVNCPIFLMANPECIMESVPIGFIAKTNKGSIVARNFEQWFIFPLEILPVETICNIADELKQRSDERWITEETPGGDT